MAMNITITNAEELDKAIAELQKQQVEKKTLMVLQFHELQESMRPINLLKSTLNRIAQPGEVRDTLIKAASGIGMGLLTKGLITGKNKGIVSAVVGKTVRVAVAKTVFNNAEVLKAYGTAIYNNLFNHKSNKAKTPPYNTPYGEQQHKYTGS